METKPLDRSYRRKVFDCGVEQLNEYLKRYALQNQKKDLARTYVVTDDENRIIGYYTLVYGSVSIDEAPREIASGVGNYPVPVILLARLAIDVNYKAKGFGKFLLRDALLRSVQASEIAGLRALFVHAKDESAKAFYEKFDFQSSPVDEFHLFLKMADIRESLTR